MMTINAFNRLIGKTTLHPLVCIADPSADRLDSDICKTCNFYALLCNNARLRLIIPGEKFLIPSGKNKQKSGYTGVLFHPDLLCDTTIEEIVKYACSEKTQTSK